MAFAALEVMERDIRKQQLGYTEEYIVIVSYLQLKMAAMEGGLMHRELAEQ